MKAHKDYRDVNIPGLYSIPKTWIDGKFKYNVFYQEGPGLRHWQFMDKGVKVICVTNITENGIDFSSYTKYISKEEYESSYKHFTVKKGNLLIASSGASWGKISEYDSDETVILNTSTIRLETSKRILNSFLKYLLESQYIQDQLSILITGSCQPNFGPTHLSKLDICLPSDIQEQRQIAAYLDYKTNQIDRFIANRKKQIELLEEQKEAVINKAVTKGIDKNSEVVKTNSLTIPYIPKSWKLYKIKFLLKQSKNAIKTGPFGSHLKTVDIQNTGTIKVINQRAVIDNEFYENEEFITKEKFDELKDFRVFPNDLLITTRGTIGKCAIFPKDAGVGVLHPCLIRLQPDERKVLLKYLIICLESGLFFKEEIKLLSNSTVIDVIYSYNLKEVQLAIPPVNVQKSILDFVSRELSERNELISKYQKQIDLMQEYKTSLISKAVTGKIDVREWQPKQTIKETV